MDKLEYSCTNESIAAVVLGLDLKSNDEVYAIGGSGDLPFAMLEYVKKVFAVDSNPKQIELIKKRLAFLLNFDRGDFLKVTEKGVADNVLYGAKYPQMRRYNLSRRNTYFCSFDSEDKRLRLDNICDNASNLKVMQADFLEGLDSVDPVSKMYLSNIEDGLCSKMKLKDVVDKLKSKLRPRGLIYSSYGLNLFYRTLDFNEEDRAFLNQSIEVDKRLSRVATIIEANTYVHKNDISNRHVWNPVVFRLK